MIAAADTPAFETFCTSHLVVIAMTIVAPIVLAVLVRKVRSRALELGICWFLGILLLVNEFIYYGYGLYTVSPMKFAQEFLPLHICGVALFLTAFTLFTRNQFMYEIAFFWGLAGTIQAILTPLPVGDFPSYMFIQFFITHSGIVISVLFITWGLKMRPRFKSILYVFILTNVCLVIAGTVNWLIDSNYMYVCHPPEGDSPFFFTPWPWYLLILEPIGVALLFIFYAPFPIADWLRRRKTPA